MGIGTNLEKKSRTFPQVDDACIVAGKQRRSKSKAKLAGACYNARFGSS
jgi:hypothetical protein